MGTISVSFSALGEAGPGLRVGFRPGGIHDDPGVTERAFLRAESPGRPHAVRNDGGPGSPGGSRTKTSLRTGARGISTLPARTFFGARRANGTWPGQRPGGRTPSWFCTFRLGWLKPNPTQSNQIQPNPTTFPGRQPVAGEGTGREACGRPLMPNPKKCNPCDELKLSPM